MHKVRIRLPATVTNIGPGLHSLGLALGLYTTIEISERTDQALVVEAEGEGAGRYSVGLRHPVTLALIRMFQHVERAPLGLNARINNQIPLESGLGAETAFLVAGVMAANNLMSLNYSRGDVLDVAAGISQRPDGRHSADGVLATVLGGLTAATMHDGKLIYRSLPVAPLRVVIVLPDIPNFASAATPERVSTQDAIFNLSRLPLLIAALREGDLTLLSSIIEDRLRAPIMIPTIPGYTRAVEAGRDAGALGFTICGDGPAILAFAEDNHDQIVAAMQQAFLDGDVKTRAWVLPIDTQGIVLSVMQSS